MLLIEQRLEPPVYRNRFGMDEYQEEDFINEKIKQFCSVIAKGNFIDENLYMLLFEYIQDNLEKYIERPYYECD